MYHSVVCWQSGSFPPLCAVLDMDDEAIKSFPWRHTFCCPLESTEKHITQRDAGDICQGFVLIILVQLYTVPACFCFVIAEREKLRIGLPIPECQYRSVITILVQGSFSVTS